MKEKIREILENNFDITKMSIDQLSVFYALYEKVEQKEIKKEKESK